MPRTIPQMQKAKEQGRKLTMLTCYDATFARLLDGLVDMLLVGDSLGMVVQGHDTTIPVTLEHMLYHTQCVSRVAHASHIIADMPFMSYQASPQEAMHNAARLMQEGGAHAVKVEGGEALVTTVQAMTNARIPVMAHIGLCPQAIRQMGGYTIQGKSVRDGAQLVKEAHMFQAAGAYAILMEGVTMEVASQITREMHVPTIGINAGPECDGQVLVIYDLLGCDPTFAPKFVQRYADLASAIQQAVTTYAHDVQSGTFPTEAHGHHQHVTHVPKKVAS